MGDLPLFRSRARKMRSAAATSSYCEGDESALLQEARESDVWAHFEEKNNASREGKESCLESLSDPQKTGGDISSQKKRGLTTSSRQRATFQRYKYIGASTLWEGAGEHRSEREIKDGGPSAS